MNSEYVLNANPDGTDVIHLRHGDERCNRDDMQQRQNIDAETADALIQLGQARRCLHCKEEDAS